MGRSSKIRHRRRRRGEASGHRAEMLTLRQKRARDLEEEKRESARIWLAVQPREKA